MIDSDDSDVILIESDDDNSRRGSSGSNCPIINIGSANAPSGDADPRNDRESSSSSSSAHSSDGVAVRRRRCDNPGAKIISLDDDINWDLRSLSSSSSSSSSLSSFSSGIPSPWKTKQASSSDRSSPTFRADEYSTKVSGTIEPSIETEYERTKRMCPTRSTNEAMRKGEMEMSSSLPSSTKEDRHTCAHHGHEPKRTNAIANREYKPKKKRRWGRPNRNNVAASATERKGADKVGILGEDHSSTTSSTSDLDTKSSPPNEGSTADRHFHCYLLRSLDPDHPLKTYIGFTTNPQRRIRQHNGILKNAGARRTKVSGRPWTFVCVVHGFQDKITALQFEWAWQNVNKSRAFRDAIGDDKLANKMKRRYGPNARLEELRILLKECLPFCLYSLTVYFPERRYHDVFNGMLKRGKNGNPYKKDDDETPCAHEPLLSIEVCSLEGMPVGREAAILQEKKKARQEAVRIHKRQQKKSTNYESDISDWLKNAKLIAEEGSCWSDSLDDDAKLIAEEGSCWSDSLDDEVGSNCVNIKTIGENNSSIDLNDKRRDSMSSMSLGENDLSRGVFSLRMDAPGEDVPEDPVGSDFSTISSTDSIRSLDDNKRDAAVTKEFHYRSEKENRLKNAQMFDRSANAAPSIGKMGTFVSNSEVVDLCNSP